MNITTLRLSKNPVVVTVLAALAIQALLYVREEYLGGARGFSSLFIPVAILAGPLVFVGLLLAGQPLLLAAVGGLAAAAPMLWLAWIAPLYTPPYVPPWTLKPVVRGTKPRQTSSPPAATLA